MQKFEKISENIHILTRLDETDRPILGVIEGSKRTMAIDTGNSVNHAKLFLSEIEKAGIRKPDMALLTHYHGDHVFGAAVIDALTFAQENIVGELEKMMLNDWEEEIKNADELMKNEFKDGINIAMKLPEITFTKKISVDLGGVTVIAEKIECDHSDDSVVAYIPEDNVVFLGDCLYCGYLEEEKKMYFTHDGIKNMAEQLKSYDADKYINSHSSVSEKEDFFDYLDEMVELAEISQSSKTVEDAIENLREKSGDEIKDITKTYLQLFFNGKNI